jgi:MerR family transcriptional regulator, thiopeptide resistance regulator
MHYSIKKIANLAGVTRRTLRYYDQIGLLSPAGIGANGYRFYDKDSLARLQQILFFRELDVPLKEIQAILERSDFSPLLALEKHRKALRDRKLRLEKLILTLDKTMTAYKGEFRMSPKEYFDGFDESQYEEEAKERWGSDEKYAQSQKKWSSYSKEQKEAIKAQGGEITQRMVGSGLQVTPGDPGVQAAIGDYLAYINRNFYTCDIISLRGLAEMWVQDPRFAVNYERIREGGAEFVREAVNIYCDQNE